MAGLSLKNLTKEYTKDVKAVDNLSLEIPDKEFVVFVGPSGCGKTTTLRMIAGLEEITDGDLFIGDTRVNDIPPKDRDIAMVFQNYALYPHMTVFENMAFALKLRKIPKDQIKARVMEAAKILELEDYLKRKPKALSGGQRQRVALGRAIVRHPKVFLMDEPLSNLDAKLRVAMRTEIAKLHQALETTFVYVTHDQTEALTMGDRIIVMKDGIMMQQGSPYELYNHPQNKFVAEFIGSPKMNVVKSRIEKDKDGVYTFLGNTRIRIDDDRASKLTSAAFEDGVYVGFRPENIHSAETRTEDMAESGFVATIDVREMMGSDTYLYLIADGLEETITARVTPTTPGKIKESIQLFIDTRNLHVFDQTTENNLMEDMKNEKV